MILITTVDQANCPACSSPSVRYDDRHRGCNACGLTWERMTEQDELDLKADAKVRGRGHAEELGRMRAIPKGAIRW